MKMFTILFKDTDCTVVLLSLENVKAMEPFMDIPVAETHHIHNEVGAACSDKSVCGSQSESISPIALQKSSNANRAFFSPRACVSAQNVDDSMLLGSPRLAIPQKQRADSNNHDPRMVSSCWDSSVGFC